LDGVVAMARSVHLGLNRCELLGRPPDGHEGGAVVQQLEHGTATDAARGAKDNRDGSFEKGGGGGSGHDES
jgi:hypothetical protein